MEFLPRRVRFARRPQGLRLDRQVLPHCNFIPSLMLHLVPHQIANETGNADLAFGGTAPGPLRVASSSVMVTFFIGPTPPARIPVRRLFTRPRVLINYPGATVVSIPFGHDSPLGTLLIRNALRLRRHRRAAAPRGRRVAGRPNRRARRGARPRAGGASRSMRAAGGSCPACSTSTPTSTSRSSSRPACRNRCATARPPSWSATAAWAPLSARSGATARTRSSTASRASRTSRSPCCARSWTASTGTRRPATCSTSIRCRSARTSCRCSRTRCCASR